MELQGVKFSTKVVKEQAKRTLVPYEFKLDDRRRQLFRRFSCSCW